MNTEGLQSAELFIRRRLEELPAGLYYHSSAHIEDVLSASEALSDAERISEADRALVRIAVLYHDAGFIVQGEEHERIGCAMVRADLPQFGFTENEIEKICGMIQATKIPQSPRNILEQIVCDADLDYLGRSDYDEISAKLEKEISERNPLTGEQWLQLQVSFLEQHTYFTKTAREAREKRKQEQLTALKNRLNT
ncbi:MAG: HD domain-containing protein [Chitinophagaceae bacterium]|nr:MAG: HD domain-containing protein [Chitinophagaceae bacterium]